MSKSQFSQFGYVWDEEAKSEKIAAALQNTSSRNGKILRITINVRMNVR